LSLKHPFPKHKPSAVRKTLGPIKMIPGIQIILILLISAQMALGQRFPFEPYFVKSRNFDVKFQDTVIKTSILTIPTGEFQFIDGHDILTQETNRYRFIGKGKKTKTTKDSLIKSQKSTLILESYFPAFHQDSSKTYIAPYSGTIWSPIQYYETRYSYILNQTGFEPLYNSEKDSTVRITLKEQGIDHEEYVIFTIDLSGDDFVFHQKKVKHTYSETFETIEEVIGKVKKENAINKFYEQFDKYDFSDSTYFVKYDGGHMALIEFKTIDNYSAIMRPHVNYRGKAEEKMLTWTMYELWRWTILNNRKEEKRKRKELKVKNN
jgi:hypothetical protein